MNRVLLERRLTAVWYGDRAPPLLLPLAWLYCGAVLIRRLAYGAGLLPTRRLDARVVVVGNITVGGSGKTPLVIALAQRLRAAGLRVGILTRGYRGRARKPRLVDADADAREAGDEAVLLARRSDAVVAAGADRVAAGQLLLQRHACDVLICDDGLQHYALGRDIEIALVDAVRAGGNGRCLPAGPLREPLSRLQQVDAVVAVGGSREASYGMSLVSGDARRLGAAGETRPLASFRGEALHAVAGIARPERFFDSLRRAGLEFQAHAFADHHDFRPADLEFGDQRPVLMTEKDAVKCTVFAQPGWWCVPVEARPDAALVDWLLARLKQDT